MGKGDSQIIVSPGHYRSVPCLYQERGCEVRPKINYGSIDRFLNWAFCTSCCKNIYQSKLIATNCGSWPCRRSSWRTGGCHTATSVSSGRFRAAMLTAGSLAASHLRRVVHSKCLAQLCVVKTFFLAWQNFAHLGEF